MQTILSHLNQGDLLVISNVANSPSEQVATTHAIALQAEKLIFLGDGHTICNRRNRQPISNVSLCSASRSLEHNALQLPKSFRTILSSAVNAVHNGVRRVHILDRSVNGVLLIDTIKWHRIGLMISPDIYQGFRLARKSDLDALQHFIRPLEYEGLF